MAQEIHGHLPDQYWIKQEVGENEYQGKVDYFRLDVLRAISGAYIETY